MANKVFTLSDKKFHKKNLDNIIRDLELNNYSKKFIQKRINSQRKKKHYMVTNNLVENNTAKNKVDYSKTFVLPNIEYFTRELKQCLNKKCNNSTVFYSPFKLSK